MPLPIRNGSAMQLAGLRRRHALASAGREIPRQWVEFQPFLSLPIRTGTASYGVICGGDKTTMDYMAAIEVSDTAAIPTELDRLRISAQRYVVFPHEGPVSTIRETWDYIWKEWLPKSGFRVADSPPFERYGPKYDVASGQGDTSIWLPVMAA